MLIVMCLNAQTNVTDKYIKNADFEVNYLTYWTASSIVMQNNAAFEKHGGVYVQKWVEKGNKVGSGYIQQEIKNLPQGNYTLKVKAQNIQQGSPETAQTGAVIFEIFL